MKIKEVMKLTGLPERTIRYYEERDLISPETCRCNGRTNHNYSLADVENLQRIIVLRRAQFTIEEILTMQKEPHSIKSVLERHRERMVTAKAGLATLSTLGRFSNKPDWLSLVAAIEPCINNIDTVLTIPENEDGAESEAASSARWDVAEQNKKRWNNAADTYAEFNQSDRFLAPILCNPAKAFHEAVFERIKQYFPDLTGISVCVPSSGDNHAVFAFAMMGANVTSCDLSEKQLENARMVASRFPWGKSIRFVCTDTMTLADVPSDSFDFVYTSNGVHVWIPDLNAMYQSIARVLKPGGIYMMYELHPFLRPYDRQGNVLKPYDMVGPFHDDDGITFAWRVMDYVNAISRVGMSIKEMDELNTEKNYDWPFWLSYDEIERGATATQSEFDYMYDWRNNPMVALPNWISIIAKKDYENGLPL